MPSVKTTLFATLAILATTVTAAPNPNGALVKRVDHGDQAICNAPSLDPNAPVQPMDDLTRQCCLQQSDSEDTEETSNSIHLQTINGHKMCIAGNEKSFWSIDYNIDRIKFVQCCQAAQQQATYAPSCEEADCSDWGILSTLSVVGQVAKGVASIAPLLVLL